MILQTGTQGPYSRTSYDTSLSSDWSKWPSRPIRSLRYIVACMRIRVQDVLVVML